MPSGKSQYLRHCLAKTQSPYGITKQQSVVDMLTDCLCFVSLCGCSITLGICMWFTPHILWLLHWRGQSWSMSWWRHQMETFSALLAICAGKSPVTRKKGSDAEHWRFLDLRLNICLSKQWRGWWFETPSHPLWRPCNVCSYLHMHWIICEILCARKQPNYLFP